MVEGASERLDEGTADVVGAGQQQRHDRSPQRQHHDGNFEVNLRKDLKDEILTNLNFSPRDSTGGLGVKMVEYVLGGSPTNKESPLALEPRLRSLKIDEVKVNKGDNALTLDSHSLRFLHLNIQGNDDKENNSSPFESNGLKKDEVNSSNGTNGIDDDKGFK